jgi:hypothetical protein
LNIRAKEAQIIRTRADADSAQEEVAKQKREIERLKRELQRAVRPTSPAPTDINDHVMGMNGFSARETTMSRSSHRMSFASTSAGDEREPARAGAFSPPGPRSESRISTTSAGDHESWKRAAEVTSQLKMRIEVSFPWAILAAIRC